VIKFLKQLFQERSYEVFTGINGIEGIALYKQNNPDLIIVDIIMPDKEGLETIRELRKLNSDVNIIAISGCGSTDPEVYLNMAKKIGVQYTFSKPIDIDLLLTTVDEIFS